jgi:hypothetical protein
VHNSRTIAAVLPKYRTVAAAAGKRAETAFYIKPLSLVGGIDAALFGIGMPRDSGPRVAVNG